MEEEEGEADEEEEEQLKEEERLGLFFFAVASPLLFCHIVAFLWLFSMPCFLFEFQRLEKTISLMILCLAYIFSPVFYTAIVTDYYDLVRGTELSSQSSSSSSFGLRVSLSSAPSYGRFLGFCDGFGAPLSFFLPLSPMLLFTPSPVFSSHRGLSLVSLQLAHLAGKESFIRLLAFDPAESFSKIFSLFFEFLRKEKYSAHPLVSG